MIQKKSLLDYYTVGVFLLQSVFYFNQSVYSICLWVLMPISFLGYGIRYRSIAFNGYLKLLMILFCWCSFTYFVANYEEAASAQVIRIWGVYLYCYVISAVSKDSTLRKFIFLAFLIILVNSCFYAYNNILSIRSFDTSADRLNDEKLNANMFGYFSLYSTFILYNFAYVNKDKYSKYCKILFWSMIPFSFYIAILTASRQILIIQLPFIAILLAYTYLSRFTLKSVLIVAAIIVSCFVLYDKYGEGMYKSSKLRSRTEKSIENDPRALLVRESLEIGLENPVFGVGPGNLRFYTSSGAFSHNSFLQLFSENGIFGVLIYSYMLMLVVMRSFIAWRRMKNIRTFSLFVIAFFYTVDNVFYVIYINPWLLGFLFLITSEISVPKQKNKIISSRINAVL